MNTVYDDIYCQNTESEREEKKTQTNQQMC